MQMNFVAELHSGDLEFSEDKLGFYVANTQDKVRSEIVQSVDLINKYSFPIVVHSISLNEVARSIFEVSYSATNRNALFVNPRFI
jgi:hypothetical protein